MMNWQDRARARMKELKLVQDDLIQPLGVKTRGAIGHYFSGRRNLNINQAYNLCRILQMSMDELFGDGHVFSEPTPTDTSSFNVPSNAEEITSTFGEIAKIPVLNAYLSAGNGYHMGQEQVVGHMSIPHDMLMEAGVDEDVARIVKISGESMEDTFHDGDAVLINTAAKRLINDKIYAFRFDGELRVKRFAKRLDGAWRIISDNPDKDRFPEEIASPHNMDQIAIIGEVVAIVFRKF